jgi:hypothetical protein
MARVENWKGTTLSFILHYQDSEGIETDSMRNPPRPVKEPRLGSFTSEDYSIKTESYLKVWNIQN